MSPDGQLSSTISRADLVVISTRLGTSVRYADLEAEEVELGDTVVRVATPRTLYRLKKDMPSLKVFAQGHDECVYVVDGDALEAEGETAVGASCDADALTSRGACG